MNERYKKIGIGILIAIGVALALYLIVQFALPVLLPFVIAWLIAAVLQPVIRFLDEKVKIPRKLAVLILVLAVIGLLVWGIYGIANRLVQEITSLVSSLQVWMQRISGDDSLINDVIDWINNLIPFADFSDQLYQIWDNLDGYLLDAINLIAGNITNIVPFLKDIVMTIPSAVVFVVVLIISCFYIACDFKKINNFIAVQFPVRARAFGTVVKQQFILTIGKYAKAYGLIVLITFTELFVGFTILGVSYSFILALITALIDIMPVLGTGLVLIPWAIYSLLTGNYFLGIGLFVLYAIITVVRQIIEPRIVGTYIGLYPLLTLMAMYIGTKLMGVFGLFLFPITLILLKKLNDDGHIKLWKKAPEEFDEPVPRRRKFSEKLRAQEKKRREKKALANVAKKTNTNNSINEQAPDENSDGADKE